MRSVFPGDCPFNFEEWDEIGCDGCGMNIKCNARILIDEIYDCINHPLRKDIKFNI